VRAAEALLWAHQATGRLPYTMLAAELLQYALRTMWDEESGGFFDRSADPEDCDQHGLLRDRLKPPIGNCEAARVLLRLSRVTEQPEFRERAIRTLASQSSSYRALGLLGAVYGSAVREVVEGRSPSGLNLSYVDWRLNEVDE
jgi:uncharacterized protein YyaL (SSP411 family)